jgi:hypothetical protein
VGLYWVLLGWERMVASLGKGSLCAVLILDALDFECTARAANRRVDVASQSDQV